MRSGMNVTHTEVIRIRIQINKSWTGREGFLEVSSSNIQENEMVEPVLTLRDGKAMENDGNPEANVDQDDMESFSLQGDLEVVIENRLEILEMANSRNYENDYRRARNHLQYETIG